jgi:hypothetical protein
VVIETNRGEKGKEPYPDQCEGKVGKKCPICWDIEIGDTVYLRYFGTG